MVSLKISKTLGLLRKLHNLLPRSALITIYKAFVRPHLDYGDIPYDQAYNMPFHHKLESIQYNACLAITGAIRGTSKEKLYQELGLESPQLRRWYRKLGMFYKIYKKKSPQYLFKLIPEKTHAYVTRNVDNIPCFKIRHNFFKNSFFPSTIIEWNNLDPTLRNSKSFIVFKNSILKFIRHSPSNFFNCNNYKGIRLITRLRLGMSHLREHKFKHNFQDCFKSNLQFWFRYRIYITFSSFNDERYTLLSTLNKIDCKLLELTKSSLSQTLLYGNTLFDKQKTHSFLTQQLNIFYPLKDSKSFLFSKFPLESLNPSRSFLKCFIIFTSYLLPYSVIFFFIFVYSQAF